MSDKDLSTSALSRLFKLGGLAGRVSASMAGNAMTNLFRSLDAKASRRNTNLVENARRVVETFGTLKGVPMKIGQMVSLHAAFLPPEVTAILSTLQQNAPAVSFEAIADMIQEELGAAYEQVQYIDPRPYAAASIGQVHRGFLKDGREVVFKVQYPGIDQVIVADLKNFKGLLGLLFSMFTKMDLEPVWEELHERLLEELDYEKEAANMRHMAALWQQVPEIVIPPVIDALSTRHVLCMPLLRGLRPEEALSRHQPRDLRDQWGRTLCCFFLGGLFEHRLIHADPNAANFAFLTDGRVIVYDFGCVKHVPDYLCKGYADLARALIDDQWLALPGLLQSLGICQYSGEPVPMPMIQSLATIVREPFRAEPPYTFGEDGEESIYERMRTHVRNHWQTAMDLVFPKDIIFIDRTISGLLGHLVKLHATGPWRDLLLLFIDRAPKEV